MKRPTRASLALAALVAVAALAVVAAALGRPRVESAIRARLAREAAQRGLVVHVESVRAGLRPLLRLEGVRLEKPGAWTLAADTLDVTLRPWGRGLIGRTRLALGRMALTGPGGLRLETVPAVWDVAAAEPDGLRAELREPARGLAATWRPAADGEQIGVSATDVPAARVFSVLREGVPLLDPGVVSGALQLARAGGTTRFDAELSGRAVRVPALSNGASTGEAPAFGQPTDVALRFAGSWRPADCVLELPRWRVSVDGAALAGSLRVAELPGDPRVDISLDVERLDFARLFRTSGLARPEAASGGTDAAAEDLGSASLSARASGRLADPASFVVTQKLDFTPPRRVPSAIAALRDDFGHEVALPGGERKIIEVSRASPDYVSIRDVPPLFVRTLLLGEDAGFFTHRGIDLAELPSAILANWARGGAARGASTITQQLAKNLFLSREKRLGRKLQELSLALLMEAALSKERILEIYLNVIEWGPGLYGLRPAAARYFHREPRELTPAQMAFLVALIPGPLKYQSSFAGGSVLPGFRPLVDDLLAKLCSLGELSEEQYQAALAEELVVDTRSRRPRSSWSPRLWVPDQGGATAALPARPWTNPTTNARNDVEGPPSSPEPTRPPPRATFSTPTAVRAIPTANSKPRLTRGGTTTLKRMINPPRPRS